jgi:hypothetical protein
MLTELNGYHFIGQNTHVRIRLKYLKKEKEKERFV